MEDVECAPTQFKFWLFIEQFLWKKGELGGCVDCWEQRVL